MAARSRANRRTRGRLPSADSAPASRSAPQAESDAIRSPRDAERKPGSGDVLYLAAIPFVLVHLSCLAVIWTGITWQALAICVALYVLRIFSIGAGYHRYFSHRAYSTSRVFQFILGFLSQTSAQRSVLWWAATHRKHHLHSDTADDPHSPARQGLFYSHVGWIFMREQWAVDFAMISDFARYPEMRWLHYLELAPATMLGVLCFLLAGWPGVIVGFMWSTVLVYHSTFSINSLAHVIGRKRYVTGDDSRNNWGLALLTMGEGWHNNHHAYQSSVRQGFRWWEFDPTYYILWTLARVGVVWNLKTPPRQVILGEQRLSSRVVDRAGEQLAAHFDPESIARAIMAALPEPELTALRDALSRTSEVLATVRLPQIPSRDEVLRRAKGVFASTRSLDEIVDRAYQRLLAAVGAQLCGSAAGPA
jgi:stearoyl-CoA desaturase (delta-9 desaturase)